MAPRAELPWRLRAPTVEDFDGVLALAEARADRLNSPTRTAREGWQRWWASQGADLALRNRVAVDGAGRVIGFADVHRPTEPFVAVYGSASVHPDEWDADGLWDALYAWTLQLASTDVALAPTGAQFSLLTESVDTDLTRKDAVARAGFKLARLFFRMRIDFDGEPAMPTTPVGVVIRRIDMDRELFDVAAAHNEAFHDHWGYTETSPQSLVAEWRRETVGRRPDFNYVAVIGGTIAGYVLCQDNYRGDSAVGLVDCLGIRPAWRRRGIALALLATAFQAFHAQGFRAVRLGVDASSPTGATRLYEKAGMHVVEQVNRYEKVLRPGIDWLHRA